MVRSLPGRSDARNTQNALVVGAAQSRRGGWILLGDAELHLGADILVPDMAGWRRERMPDLPEQTFIDVAPDWVCEMVTPTTAAFDRTQTLPIYCREQVPYVWFIEPLARTLEAYLRGPERWELLACFCDDALVRVAPFDAIEFELGRLWYGKKGQ